MNELLIIGNINYLRRDMKYMHILMNYLSLIDWILN